MSEQALINYEAEKAALAEQYAREATVSGSFITTSGGLLQIGGEPVLGNQLCTVILDSIRENTFYEGDYNPDVPMPPTCYAFGRVEADMAPHISMQGNDYFKPQAVQCKGCPWNEWGSADKGKGKACQNRRRLALLPAGYYVPRPRSRDFDLQVYDDPKHYETADVSFLKLPVTSVRGYDKYVHQLATHRLPPCGAVTRVYCEPDPKTQYAIKFEFLGALPEEIFAVVFPRRAAAEASLQQGYAPPEEPPF